METLYTTKFVKKGRCMECGQPYGFEVTPDGKIVNEVNYCTCFIEKMMNTHHEKHHNKKRVA